MDKLTVEKSLLDQLELRVSALVQTCEHLKRENHLLREKQLILTQERNKLIEKNQLTKEKVRHVLGRLKSSFNST